MSSNSGNSPLLELLEQRDGHVLNVGCGSADNARFLREKRPNLKVTGITHSSREAAVAASHMDRCLIGDVEAGVQRELEGGQFNVLLFSYVLEHFRQPWAVVGEYAQFV